MNHHHWNTNQHLWDISSHHWDGERIQGNTCCVCRSSSLTRASNMRKMSIQDLLLEAYNTFDRVGAKYGCIPLSVLQPSGHSYCTWVSCTIQHQPFPSILNGHHTNVGD